MQGSSRGVRVRVLTKQGSDFALRRAREAGPHSCGSIGFLGQRHFELELSYIHRAVLGSGIPELFALHCRRLNGARPDSATICLDVANGPLQHGDALHALLNEIRAVSICTRHDTVTSRQGYVRRVMYRLRAESLLPRMTRSKTWTEGVAEICD